jgi:hypothetical protein
MTNCNPICPKVHSSTFSFLKIFNYSLLPQLNHFCICPLPHFQATKQPGQESVPPTTAASTTPIICGTNCCCFQTSVCIHSCTPTTSVTISSHAIHLPLSWAPPFVVWSHISILQPFIRLDRLILNPIIFPFYKLQPFPSAESLLYPKWTGPLNFMITKNILKFLAQRDGLPVASDSRSNLK